MKKKITIIQTSLSEVSKTEITTQKVIELLKIRDVEVDYINLKDHPEIPFCDGRDIEEYSEEVQDMFRRIQEADCYILAYPIYNYCFSGVCKNFIDIFSHAMSNKKLGIINNSGGVRSWNHGVSQLMASLGMHNNVTIVQPIVHSWSGDFDNEILKNQKIIENIEKMLDSLQKD